LAPSKIAPAILSGERGGIDSIDDAGKGAAFAGVIDRFRADHSAS